MSVNTINNLPTQTNSKVQYQCCQLPNFFLMVQPANKVQVNNKMKNTQPDKQIMFLNSGEVSVILFPPIDIMPLTDKSSNYSGLQALSPAVIDPSHSHASLPLIYHTELPWKQETR